MTCLIRSKTCIKCGQVKELTEYYNHPRMADGHLNACISCLRSYSKEHRKENIDYYRQYDINRSQKEPRRTLSTRIAKEYRINNPERYKATNKVNNALRDGKIQKLPCQVCGKLKSVAHHVAYDLPLDVVWLCQVHHKEVHSMEL